MAVNTPYKDTTATTTNHTANYDLPLWAGEDTTSWLTQMNDAMNKIDDGMVDAKSKALEVVGIAADAKKLADETKAESDESAKIVAGYNDRLTAVEEKVVEHTDDITNLNTRCNQFDVELHSVQEVQKKTTADLATLAEKVDSNKEEVDGKITGLTEKQTELENAQTSQGSNITKLTGEVDNLKTRVDGDDTAIAGLTTRMTAVEKTAQTTQTNLTTLSENTQNSFTELDTRLSGDEKQITQIDGRVTALEEGGSSGSGGNSIKVAYRYNGTVTSGNASFVKVGKLKCDYIIFEDGSEAIDIYCSETNSILFTTTQEATGSNIPINVEFAELPAKYSVASVCDMCTMSTLRYAKAGSDLTAQPILIRTTIGKTSNSLSLIFSLMDTTAVPTKTFYTQYGGTWRFLQRGFIN